MNRLFRTIKASALFLAFSMAMVSCGGSDDEDPIIAPEVPYAPAGNKYLSRLEIPKLEAGNIFIQHSTKIGADSVMTYCLEYNPDKFHSRWVAFRFDETTKQKNVDRSDEPFTDDPYLPNSLKIGSSGFSDIYVDSYNISHQQANKNYFSRGHLCASADRVYSREANVKTFYMTNMSPQTATFNSGIWLSLEGKIQNWGRNVDSTDTLYVVKGGTVDKDKIWGSIRRSTGSNVAVPKYYFMALLYYKNNQYSSIGFLVEHDITKIYPSSNNVKKEELLSLVVSIDELEKFTGIDFFHNLPDAIENKVEASCNPSEWEF